MVQTQFVRAGVLHRLRSEDRAGSCEAIEQGTWQDVDAEIARVAATIHQEAALVRQAATDLANVR